MTIAQAKGIVSSTCQDDCTGLEMALIMIIRDLGNRLDEANGRIQTLIDSTGTWKEFR